MSDAVDQKLTAKEFGTLAQSRLRHVVSVAGPKPAAARLVVMDELSGKVGSVFVIADGPVAAAQRQRSDDWVVEATPFRSFFLRTG